jgi:hypothetical protein
MGKERTDPLAKFVFLFNCVTFARQNGKNVIQVLAGADWSSVFIYQFKVKVTSNPHEHGEELSILLRLYIIRLVVVGRRQLNVLRQVHNHVEVFKLSLIDCALRVVDKTATHQYGKGEDSHIVVLVFFGITEPFSIDNQQLELPTVCS